MKSETEIILNRFHRYFLNVADAMHTATPSSAALGSRISSGCTLTGSAR